MVFFIIPAAIWSPGGKSAARGILAVTLRVVPRTDLRFSSPKMRGKRQRLVFGRDYVPIHAYGYRWHSPRLLTCPSKDVKSSTLANRGASQHVAEEVARGPLADCNRRGARLLADHACLLVTWRNVDAFRELFFLAPWSVPRVRPITWKGIHRENKGDTVASAGVHASAAATGIWKTRWKLFYLVRQSISWFLWYWCTAHGSVALGFFGISWKVCHFTIEINSSFYFLIS